MKSTWVLRGALPAAVLAVAMGVAGAGWAQQDGPAPAVAEMPLEEVEAAYQAGDFATARAGLLPHAEAGDMVAQYRLGFMMANASGGPSDRLGAIEWLDKAAAQGHSAAPLLLAQTLISGAPELPDYQRAAALFEELSDADDSSKFYLAQLLRQGLGTTANPERAFKLMQEVARKGEAVAQLNLSQMYARGEGTDADNAQSLRWLLEAADSGNHTAQISLYSSYAEGRGVPKDPGKARQWLETAAGSGMPLAQRILGTELLLAEGEGADPVRGVSLLLKAAEAGEAGAQNNLGMAYATGLGVEKDDVKSLRYYQLAADQGLPRAALITGDFYASGRAGEVDYDKAAHYYIIAHQNRQKEAGGRLGSLIAAGELAEEVVGEENTLYFIADAALAGDPAALERLQGIADGGETYAHIPLGDIYLNGAGVEADTTLAAKHYKTAAEVGYAYAQAELAALYAAGDGVEQNMIEAHKWANVAAANGSELGAERRDTYANLMTPEEIAEAQARARVHIKK